MDDHSTAATAGVIATLALVYGLVLLAVVAFSIWVYWRIFAKAGYNGALSLLNFGSGRRTADLHDHPRLRPLADRRPACGDAPGVALRAAAASAGAAGNVGYAVALTISFARASRSSVRRRRDVMESRRKDSRSRRR